MEALNGHILNRAWGCYAKSTQTCLGGSMLTPDLIVQILMFWFCLFVCWCVCVTVFVFLLFFLCRAYIWWSEVTTWHFGVVPSLPARGSAHSLNPYHVQRGYGCYPLFRPSPNQEVSQVFSAQLN